MLKQRRLNVGNALRGLAILQAIPLRYVGIDLDSALNIAHKHGLYAYDAYIIECAARHAAPLLTLDGRLRRAAEKAGIRLIEV